MYDEEQTATIIWPVTYTTVLSKHETEYELAVSFNMSESVMFKGDEQVEDLVYAYGLSGAAIWQLQEENYEIQLVGIASDWAKNTNEILFTRIRRFMDLLDSEYNEKV